MTIDILQLMREKPELLVFFVLGLGYLVGQLKIAGLELGTTAGVLLVSLVFGHYGFTIDPMFETLGFIAFIFTVGYQAGPKFFGVFASNGSKCLALAVFLAVFSVALVAVLSSVFGFENGMQAGLLAGALTSTPSLVAAQDAIGSGIIKIPEGFTSEQVLQNITSAYAITYVFGLIGLVLFIRIFPKLIGVDLAREAEAHSGNLNRPSAKKHMPRVFTRAFELKNDTLVGKGYSSITTGSSGVRALHSLKRDGKLIEIDDDGVFQPGDRVLISGYPKALNQVIEDVGPEVFDNDLRDFTMETSQVVVTRNDVVGKSLGDIGITKKHGCFVQGYRRIGFDLNAEPSLQIEKGDVLTIVGPMAQLEAVGRVLGYGGQKTQVTDIFTVVASMIFGIILGSIAIKFGSVPIGLGTAGGLLLSGLIVGWVRSIHPTFGHMPPAARWLFMELGLMFFMAGVGLRAGAGIVEALQNVGVTLFISGILVTTLPVCLGYAFGRIVLKLNPSFLLGALTGAMTSTPSLSVITEESKSQIPALGYTGAYAFANVLLTIAGMVVMRI